MTTQPFTFRPFPLVPPHDLDFSSVCWSFADSCMVNLDSVRAKGRTPCTQSSIRRAKGQRSKPPVGGLGSTGTGTGTGTSCQCQCCPTQSLGPTQHLAQIRAPNRPDPYPNQPEGQRSKPPVGGLPCQRQAGYAALARPNGVQLKHKRKASSGQKIYKKKVITSYETICWTIKSISNKAGQSLSPTALTFTQNLPNYETFLFFCFNYSIKILKFILKFSKMNVYLNQDTKNISFYSQKKRFLNNLLNIQKLFLQFTFDLLPKLQLNQKFQKEVFL